jgi:hypothetical protein
MEKEEAGPPPRRCGASTLLVSVGPLCLLLLFSMGLLGHKDILSLVDFGHPDQSSLHTHRPWTPSPALWWPGQDATLDSGKTLVIYVYFEDPGKKDNLEFFLDVGMQERDDIDYVVVVQGETTIQVKP